MGSGGYDAMQEVLFDLDQGERLFSWNTDTGAPGGFEPLKRLQKAASPCSPGNDQDRTLEAKDASSAASRRPQNSPISISFVCRRNAAFAFNRGRQFACRG